MEYKLYHQPSYTLAQVMLKEGLQIRAEAGAMVAMSPNIDLKSKMQGGFLSSLKRSVFGKESFFQSTFTATDGEGEVLLAPRAPGDIMGIEMKGGTYVVQGGSYLAGDMELDVDTGFGGFKSFFSGEGIFWLKVTGVGTLLVSSFGGIYERDLAAGENYIVDTGHIVAFEGTASYEIKKAASGWISSMTSGEGLVCRFTGPGKVYLQSRNITTFVDWLSPFLPTPSPNTNG